MKTAKRTATITQAEFAREQKVDRSMVTKWIAAGLPAVDGRIDPAAARAWLAANTEHSPSENLTEARTRKERALATLREIEAAQAGGLLIPIADFAKAMSEMIGVARARLLGLPASLAPIVAVERDPAKCQQIIQVGVYEALNELAHTGHGLNGGAQ